MIDHFYSELSAAFPEDDLYTDLLTLNTTGAGDWPAWFAVTDLAVATIGVAGVMLSRLRSLATDELAQITVDRRLASFWFKRTLRPQGWQLPPLWNTVSGNYRTKDGWIRLHANVPTHRQAALSVLAVDGDKTAVSQAVARWKGQALMQEVVTAGGCAAVMNSVEVWRRHPQGAAVAQEPLIIWQEQASVPASEELGSPDRPLTGLRVLDLTRILAGPVATRFLAAYGADVLRIDPPNWDEPGNVPEMTLGKRCAGLDLRLADDREMFNKLLQQADVLVHGYRPGALAKLGYNIDSLRAINPGLIDVSLDAYGWSGPWAGRRGFDSLVQMSCGIADFGMKQEQADQPVPLPVQALDYGTGYLMAAAVLHALYQRRKQGAVLSARLSLARTAQLILSTQLLEPGIGLADETDKDLDPAIEKTDWGAARRVRFPLGIEGTKPSWRYPARRLRTSEPVW